MSRFFAAGYTSDSSSSEEDLLSTSEEEMMSSSSENEFSTDSEFGNDDEDESSDDDDSDYVGKGPSYFLKSNFLKGGDDSDSDSDGEGRKVVKSAKEKLLDDITESVDAVYNAKNLENWQGALTEFDRVGKLLVRVHQQQIAVPNLYYKMLAQLDETIAETSGDKEKRKLPADQSRAFNNLRQRVRKQVREFNAHMELYHEKPELFDAEEPVEIAGTTQESSAAAVVGTVSGTARVMSPVFARLKTVVEARGKKNSDKYEQVAILEKLLEEAKAGKNTFELISVYQMLLSVRFDAGAPSTHMPVDLWLSNATDASDFLTLLEKNIDSYQVSEHGERTDDLDIEPAANAKGVHVVQGSIAAITERLDDEFTRCLQFTDPHSTEYLERLANEPALYRLLVRTQVYVQSTAGPEEHLARLVSRRIDHLYYKPDTLISVAETAAWDGVWLGASLADSPLLTKGSGPADTVHALTEFLAQQRQQLFQRAAVLAHTYYLAVNGRYTEARARFLQSQMHHQIHHADAATQVLYNRALVQMGIAAFKSGAIDECHQILNETISSQRLKELLGQGFNSKYPSQATVAEKQRLLPFHMHINLELVECVFMTASMLIEIPALAAAATASKDPRRKQPIKSFRSKLEFHDRQFFTGPPESIKDHLIYASKSLQRGHWAQAYDLLASIKIWRLLSDSDSLLAMLKQQLQVEGLRTYIFTYKAIFTKLSVANLAATFELAQETVTDIVDKMFANGEIKGNLENTYLNFATDEPQRSKLQELAIVMNEKVGSLNEKNEMTASNGYGRKQVVQQHQQQQKEQKEQKESLQEENSRFRYANVTTNTDEFED